MALWTPSDLGAKVGVWLRADTLPQATGAAVGTWPDSGSRGNDATGVGSPTIGAALNGSKTVRLAGPYFALPSGVVSGVTSAAFLALWKRDEDPPGDSAQTGGPIGNFSNTGMSDHNPWVDGNTYDGFHSASRYAYTTPASKAAWNLFGVRRNATNYSASQNGATIYNVDDTNGFRLPPGSNQRLAGTNDYFLVGNIAEIAYARDYLTADEWARLEGYMAWKWGLQSLLPAGHAYKFAAPQQADPASSGSAAGSGTASGQGAAIARAAGSSTAGGSATAQARATTAVAGSSAATSAAQGDGRAVVSAAGVSNGASAAAAAGMAVAAGQGSSIGIATAQGAAAGSAVLVATGTSIGLSTAQGAGASRVGSSGAAIAQSTTQAAGAALAISLGSATSSSQTAGEGGALSRSTGLSIVGSSATGAARAFSLSSGVADGHSTAVAIGLVDNIEIIVSTAHRVLARCRARTVIALPRLRRVVANP